MKGKTIGLTVIAALAVAVHLGVGGAVLAGSRWTGWAADAVLAGVALKLAGLGWVAGRGGTRRALRTAYERHNQGDHAVLLRRFADGVRHEHHGGGPLAGTRTGHTAMAQFLGTLADRLPGHWVDVEDIAVTGPPWRAVAIAWLTVTVPVPSEPATHSTVAQRVRIRWGKITHLETLPGSDATSQAFTGLAGVTPAGPGTGK
jgi:ketosteroid isomerase-like protein